jgi:uncharacterized membrane protein YdjX (TVP38/TMEM64 family)
MTIIHSLRKWSLLFLLVIVGFLLFYFGLLHYLSFESINHYQGDIKKWSELHYFSAVNLYIICFALLIACAIPCATVLTLAGGFLFGIISALYAEVATTIGGLILFFAVRTSIGHWIAQRSRGWIRMLNRGFQRNAFQYIILLRLVPVFPCWISNVSAGALNVPVRTFILATLIGIFPSTLIYTLVGRGLDTFFTNNEVPTWKILLSPNLFFPLLALIIFTLLPIFYKLIMRKAQKK